MRKFGLIGYPLSHSFSEKYFTEKFAREGIEDCVYELYPIGDINELPRLLQKEKLEGLNITIPYKKAVLPFLTGTSGEVKAIMACNCITIKDKSLLVITLTLLVLEKLLKGSCNHIIPGH